MGDQPHRHPRFLPDGRHFLWVARSSDASSSNTILLGSLDGGDAVPLLRSPVAAECAAGHLLFIRDGMLVAQPFDVRRRELGGEARPLAEHVLADPRTAAGVFSVSSTGVLVYQTGNPVAPKALEWLDRRGSTLERLGESFVSTRFLVAGERRAQRLADVREDALLDTTRIRDGER